MKQIVSSIVKNMRSSRQRLNESSGQVVLIFFVYLVLIVLFTTAAVDVGLMLNDRRDGQADVDRIAMAGALALTLEPSPTEQALDKAAALDAAASWAAANDVDVLEPDTTLNVEVISNCYSADDGVYTGVVASLTREPPSIFVSLLSILDWQVETQAVACAGRTVEMIGFLPIALSEASSCFEPDGAGGFQPRLGELCDVVMESGVEGQHGQLGIDIDGQCSDGNSSGAVLKENVINGVQVICAVNDSVVGNSGANVGPLKQALKQRFVNDGQCEDGLPAAMEPNFTAGNVALNAAVDNDLHSPSRTDGPDDFYEVWAYDPTGHPAANLTPYKCGPVVWGEQTSPRNVNLIAVRDWQTPDGLVNNSYIVRGFVRVYLEGCSDRNDIFRKDCNVGGGKFTIHARFVQQLGITKTDLGLSASYGDLEVFLKQ